MPNSMLHSPDTTLFRDEATKQLHRKSRFDAMVILQSYRFRVHRSNDPRYVRAKALELLKDADKYLWSSRYV